MDLRTYFQLFWVPAIASAGLLVIVWIRDGSSGRAPAWLAGWFLAAFIAQYVGTPASVMWVVGLVSQTVLVIALLLKAQVDQ
jgi:hypothetical protein